MIALALLSFLAVPSAPASHSPGHSSSLTTQEIDHEKEIAAAGEDVDKLLELARAWKTERKTAASKAAFKRVLELDAENEEAHKGLRHPRYDGKWFDSYSAMSKYKREETKRMTEKGLARFGDKWVPIADVPYMKMGWVKNDGGTWVDPHYIRMAEHEKKMLAEGRELRREDSTWVHLDDFDKWREGLWKCGEEWLKLEDANAFHSKIGTWWRARGDYFELLTTCPMDTLLKARWQADQTYGDLARIFGLQPEHPPVVVVLKNLSQYNFFATGDDDPSRDGAETSGFSAMHHSYFADSWFDKTSTPPRFLGTGVGYWDTSSPKLAAFGSHSVRHAAGIAYAEAITFSVQAIGTAISAGSAPNRQSFWGEKPVLPWLYYGAASYVERYCKDRAPNVEDPMRLRAWSLENLLSQGELDSLEDILSFKLTHENVPGSTRLINEAGLVVSFMIDGGCRPVIEAHRAYKAALRSGEGVGETLNALHMAILENKEAFGEYAGIPQKEDDQETGNKGGGDKPAVGEGASEKAQSEKK